MLKRRGRNPHLLAVTGSFLLILACSGGPGEGEPQDTAKESTQEAVPSSGTGSTGPVRTPQKAGISVTVPQGTIITVALLDHLSSESSTSGDPFRAEVRQPVAVGNRVVIPPGSLVRGTVQEAQPSTRVKGRASLQLAFTEIQLPGGNPVPFPASLRTQAEGTTKKDVAIIGGSTVGGAVLGRVLGEEDDDALKGAIVGGAIGAGIVLATKGKPVELPPDTLLALTLDEPITLKVGS